MDKTLVSLRQAVKIVRSLPKGGQKRWPRPQGTEIQRLRARLGMSQAEFARRFGLELASLKSWENDRRVPEQPSCLLLKMIGQDPMAVAKLVHKVQAEVDKKEFEPA
jgi:putative transcriptional regulator